MLIPTEKMKVKYIGPRDLVAFKRDKAYEVIGVEGRLWRVMTELEEDYLFTPALFEVVSEEKSDRTN